MNFAKRITLLTLAIFCAGNILAKPPIKTPKDDPVMGELDPYLLELRIRKFTFLPIRQGHLFFCLRNRLPGLQQDLVERFEIFVKTLQSQFRYGNRCSGFILLKFFLGLNDFRFVQDFEVPV